MIDWHEERDERLALACAIGYQIYDPVKATEQELELWAQCVNWARNGCVGPRPYIPKRVVVTYEQFKKQHEKQQYEKQEHQ